MNAPTRFIVSAALQQADELMSAPPCFPWIVRPEPKGELVVRFALPLELCVPLNRVARKGAAAQTWKLGAIKSTAYAMMRTQNGGRVQSVPLGGRPFIRCLRMSSKEPDAHDSSWIKNPIDRLTSNRHGLGYLVDDGPRFVEVAWWWERVRPSFGAVVVELYTGAAA